MTWSRDLTADYFSGPREQLNARKRPVFGRQDPSAPRLELANIRRGSEWVELELTPEKILRLDLITQHQINAPEDSHMMWRLSLTDGTSLILTVNPHEVEGGSTIGRHDDIHWLVFQILDGEKAFAKITKNAVQDWINSWRLSLTPKEIFNVVCAFARLSESRSGRSKFQYNDNNCSRNLWDALFLALPGLLPQNDEKQEILALAVRGRNAVTVAEKLALLEGPSYWGTPAQWVAQQTQLVCNYLLNTKIADPAPTLNVRARIAPKRNPFLQIVYAQKAIRKDWLPYLLGDKLITGRVIEACLGEKSALYMPKCRGLKEFLETAKLLDPQSGALVASKEDLTSALHSEFPQGFLVKKCMGFGSQGRDFFLDEALIVEEVLRPHSTLYQAENFFRPFHPAAFNAVAFASGEEYFLMGKVPGTQVLKDSQEITEFRAHSLYETCLNDGVQSRWERVGDITASAARVVSFVNEFLSAMPPRFSFAQGFSFDVFIPKTGAPQLLEINTNRGREKFWSDYLKDPQVLAAHARFFEERLGWKFEGPEGETLRDGLGSLHIHLLADLQEWLQDVEQGEKHSEFWFEQLVRRTPPLIREALQRRPAQDPTRYFHELAEMSDPYLKLVEQIQHPGDDGWRALIRWAKTQEHL